MHGHVICPVCNKSVPAHVINEHLDKGCSSVSTSTSRPITLCESTPASKKQAKHTSALAPIFAPKVQTSSTQPFDLSPGEPDASSPSTSGPSQVKRSSEVNLVTPPRKKRKASPPRAHVPLAEILRPKQLSQFIGQSHLMQQGSLLSTMLQTKASWSLIFWGPPGCGKTTLAKLIAQESDAAFKELSATASGVNEVKAVVAESKKTLSLLGKRTILFLDEIHRFNKAQQDVLLPFVEQGLLQLIGATTENPSFRIIGALLSRCRVLRLEPLSDQQMADLLSQSLQRVDQINCEDPQAASYVVLPPSITPKIVSMARGDARVALSLLEIALKSPKNATETQIMDSLKQSLLTSYDRTGDDHYDMISALHKSVRGSNGSAAMYWLARMLTAGEDPLFIARRMVVCASEDIGLADSHALPLAMATLQACQVIGMPECRINLAHLVAYLSEAPKSTRAYEAYKRAEEAAKGTPMAPVPLQIRNAPTAMMEEMGYGENYRYNPDFRHPVHNQYLPPEVEGSEFLYKEGDTRGKVWDEDALREWEKEENGGAAVGRAGCLVNSSPYLSSTMSGSDSDSDDSREYASIPTSPRIESSHHSEAELTHEDGENKDEESDSGKDKKSDTFRVLVTGFGPYGQWEVNPSWLAVQPLHNLVLQTDPANHPRAPLADDKPAPLIDEKLLVPRSIHISTLEIPATYQSILNTVPGLHLRPPVVPEQVRDQFKKPPSTSYDLMLHIGLAGRGPLRLERCGHKLGYNMKDAEGRYAPVVIPQPKDFSRRGPDTRSAILAERAERDRLANPELPNSLPGDINAKQNHGFGGPAYDAFADELNTDLDVSRIIQDLRQLGIEALQTIYSSMDGGHFLGDFLYYCSLAESKRSANPYEKRRNTQVLFLHCAPVGHPLESEEVTDALKRIILWVCNELQICGTDDTLDLPPVGTNTKSVPNRTSTTGGTGEAREIPVTLSPSNPSSTDSALPAQPLSPPPVRSPSPPTHGSSSFTPLPDASASQPPPVKPLSTLPKLPLTLRPVQPPTQCPPSPVSSTNDSEYHSPS